jgi:DNA replication protein DnaC
MTMNTQLTLDQLRSMNLYGMASAYEAATMLPVHEQPAADTLLGQLVDAEQRFRKEQSTKRYLLQSKIRYPAILEQVHCNAARNLSKDQLLSLADCTFIGRGENILITGATGCGKSYLACALGRYACSLGYRTLYFGMNRFLERIAQTKLDGTFVRVLNQIERTHLIILDDVGLQPLDATTRIALLQILEDRYGKQAVMITSQLPVAQWHDVIGEPTIADGIMDRLVGNAHRLELKGESMRRQKLDKNV